MKKLFAMLAIAASFTALVGCNDKSNTKENDKRGLVGEWKLTFREGAGDDAGYILYDFKADGTGVVTEIDGGRVDNHENIKKWTYDSEEECIVCIVEDEYEDGGGTYLMELKIVEGSVAGNKMKWICVGMDNNRAYPVVRLN
jgi:hypothetical protein